MDVRRASEKVHTLENFAGLPPTGRDLSDPSDLVELVRSVWRDTLSFDPDDNDTGFFDSGGDSHLLFVLVDRLSKLSGLKLKALDVLKADTINGHAELLARLRRALPGEPVNGS
jgi:acyl carrier protein